MKKNLLILFLSALSTVSLRAQCVYTCSNYAVSPITYTTFPSGTLNLAPTFTNSFLTGNTPDDGSVGPIPIGFSFDFYCNSYTNVDICTNGFIIVDYTPYQWVTQYCDPTQAIPNSTFPNGMIAFNMTDMDLTQSGAITYTTVGVAPYRMFIVTYSNVPCFSTPTNLNNGQIVLYETSNIIEIYTGSASPDTDQGNLGGTQGIENTLGTIAVTPPGRNANNTWGGSGASSTAYRFSPYTAPTPTSITGNTLVCQGAVTAYQAGFIPGASSYTWSFPSGWLGSSTLSAITTTVGASGTLSVSATYTCGSSAPATLNVSVMPAPVVSIGTPTPGIICSGKTVTFNPTGAVTYTLNPAGATGVPPFTDMPPVTTVYSVSGTSTAGCVSVNTATATVTVKDSPTVTVNSGSICLGQTFTITPIGATNYAITGGFFNVSPTMAAQYSYSVTGTGTNGCVSNPVVSTLTVNALPTLTASATRTSICVKESDVLIVSGAVTYTWSTTSTNHSITVSPITNTFYVVTGTDAHGCQNTATVNVTVRLCTGIEELNDDQVVKLYPNPSNGFVEVRMDAFTDQTFIEVYNAIGQLILTEKVQDASTTLNLKAYSNGLYYVKVKTAGEERTLKLVKQ